MPTPHLLTLLSNFYALFPFLICDHFLVPNLRYVAKHPLRVRRKASRWVDEALWRVRQSSFGR